MFNKRMAGLCVALLVLAGCAQDTALNIDYERYTLENGLEVVLHKDTSDPIASVAVLYHVGSNREEKGRTGFAHLFEHMMFQESQHVGQDQFFKKIQEAGGTLNGGTWQDGTIYYEVVPKNALEMALWLESDRMGFLLSTVTQEAFINQQDVVQNEKRQRVDNQPYGHTNYVVDKLMFPENHPYNWQVIGSLEDLKNATLEDVRDFFLKWYGPNNATLVVAGDFDDAQAKAWIEKYFGELQSAEDNPDPAPQTVTLDDTRRAFHEDNFARSPELNMVFPTPQQYDADAYALGLLGQLLAGSKEAPLYNVIVEEKKLAPSVSAFQNSMEVAGKFQVRVRAFPNTPLQQVEDAIQEALMRFETNGFTEADLNRYKASTETGFYNGISSVLGKAFQLAQYNEYAGDPGFVAEDIQNSLDVTVDDVWRVFNTYIKGKPYVLTSFVPQGQTELVADNSDRFPVVEESIADAGVSGSSEVVELTPVLIEEIPTSFDRTVQPTNGPSPQVTLPEVWTHTYTNGLKLYGIEHRELPLVDFALTIKGGMLLDDPNKVGVANLMTDMMMEGTANKTPIELERALDNLGANIGMFTGNENIVIQGNTLTKKLEDTYTLFEEILLEPRWDETEFARIKEETIEGINRRKANPAAVASSVFRKVLYGDGHMLSNTSLGTAESVAAISLEDLKAFYANNYSPSVSHISVVGNISKAEAVTLFQPLEEKWSEKAVSFPENPTPPDVAASQLYFVDIPGAKQSEIRIGYLALPYDHPDYYPATVMNYKLGGSFNGNLNLILREEKGFTYGARSFFAGSSHAGPFTASAAVRSNSTRESVEIFKEEMEKYSGGIDEADLEFTKNALVQSNTRRFETLFALRNMLDNIASYSLDNDYIKQQEQFVQGLTNEAHRELAQKYITPDKMVYLVVGDAATQLAGLRTLGLGQPVMLDQNGVTLD